jgi:hypothetical protein
MNATPFVEGPPDEFRSLMEENCTYSAPPMWRIEASPDGAVIRVQSLWKTWSIYFTLFLLLLMGSGLYGAAKWVGMPNGFLGAWFCWGMAVVSLVGIFLIEKYRSKQAWFVFHPSDQTVSCPRLNKVFAIDEIRALQLATGKAKTRDPDGATIETLTQLNLIVQEDGGLKRYPLIGDFTPGRLLRQSELLARHCGIQLRRDKGLFADWS